MESSIEIGESLLAWINSLISQQQKLINVFELKDCKIFTELMSHMYSIILNQ